eukprot:TRINITY_DN5196_c0_g1_i1.p3 TRINITY_DN5196_c0_g1~~TRINITY_DN5196_c0_g1_i1.p3  ORF type:complete len:178 (+),score=48.22 TRINITY_DN5196_c0_g1_i1:13-546(+)
MDGTAGGVVLLDASASTAKNKKRGWWGTVAVGSSGGSSSLAGASPKQSALHDQRPTKHARVHSPSDIASTQKDKEVVIHGEAAEEEEEEEEGSGCGEAAESVVGAGLEAGAPLRTHGDDCGGPVPPGLVYVAQLFSAEEQAQLLRYIDEEGTWLSDLKRRVQHYGFKYDYTCVLLCA